MGIPFGLGDRLGEKLPGELLATFGQAHGELTPRSTIDLRRAAGSGSPTTRRATLTSAVRSLIRDDARSRRELFALASGHR